MIVTSRTKKIMWAFLCVPFSLLVIEESVEDDSRFNGLGLDSLYKFPLAAKLKYHILLGVEYTIGIITRVIV